MIATVSPAASSVEETLSTLRYAHQARRVVNVARVNEDTSAQLIRGERVSAPSSSLICLDDGRLRLRRIRGFLHLLVVTLVVILLRWRKIVGDVGKSVSGEGRQQGGTREPVLEGDQPSPWCRTRPEVGPFLVGPFPLVMATASPLACLFLFDPH